jgi:rubrerythrin
MSFCLEEVFEMACQIERDGAEFYRRAAEEVESPEARELFAKLAEWEKHHEKVFGDLRETIPEEKRTEYVDPYGEASAYVDAMARGQVFDPGQTPNWLPSTPQGVLESAVGKEKDSIVFYLGMKEAVPSGAEQVDKIIAEEMRHIRILSRLASQEAAKTDGG